MIIVVSKTHAATWYIGLGGTIFLVRHRHTHKQQQHTIYTTFYYQHHHCLVDVCVCVYKQQQPKIKRNCGNQKYSNINANVKGYVHNIFFSI